MVDFDFRERKGQSQVEVGVDLILNEVSDKEERNEDVVLFFVF